jgi:hypothetical protein
MKTLFSSLKWMLNTPNIKSWKKEVTIARSETGTDRISKPLLVFLKLLNSSPNDDKRTSDTAARIKNNAFGVSSGPTLS